MNKLIDRFDRGINYLRISVTDRCNLRCIYCMPRGGISHKHQDEILSFEEIHRIVRIGAELGIRKVRITGGEPLVRRDLPLLIAKLKKISGIEELTLTTNGIYLSARASSLKEAGLDRVNISLDSIIAERFEMITRGGSLKSALDGIKSALSAGLLPIKINMVLLNGFNIDEIVSFAKLTETMPLCVRFIEYMSTSLAGDATSNFFFSALDAKKICAGITELIPVDDGKGGVAKVFRLKGFLGTIGFISPISSPFCSSCNKLRLTSDGRLRSCLHSSSAIDLKTAMAEGASDEELAGLIKMAAASKPESRNLSDSPLGVEEACENFSMCQIGG